MHDTRLQPTPHDQQRNRKARELPLSRTLDYSTGDIKPSSRLGKASKAKIHWHRFPLCHSTGKRRLGERKDVKLALQAARRARSVALIEGVSCSRREVRGYRCAACHGWHLTSKAAS